MQWRQQPASLQRRLQQHAAMPSRRGAPRPMQLNPHAEAAPLGYRSCAAAPAHRICTRGCNTSPQVVREADGYQGHLVSPEFGLRRLIEDAMLLVLDPVVNAVHRVHLLLVEAARYDAPWTLPSRVSRSTRVSKSAVAGVGRHRVIAWGCQSFSYSGGMTRLRCSCDHEGSTHTAQS